MAAGVELARRAAEPTQEAAASPCASMACLPVGSEEPGSHPEPRALRAQGTETSRAASGFRHGLIRLLARGCREPACLSALLLCALAAWPGSHMVARTGPLSSCGKSLFLCSLSQVLRLGLDGLASPMCQLRTEPPRLRVGTGRGGSPARRTAGQGSAFQTHSPAPGQVQTGTWGSPGSRRSFLGGMGDRMRRSRGVALPGGPQPTP